MLEFYHSTTWPSFGNPQVVLHDLDTAFGFDDPVVLRELDAHLGFDYRASA